MQKLASEPQFGRRYSVVGPSMFPLVRPMEVVLERVELWRPGDIVAFIGPTGDRLIIHRIIAVGEAAVTTRGDTNLVEDPPVPVSALIGKVVRVELCGYGIPVPASGPLAGAQRRVGLAWGQLAPHLRLWFGRLRRRRKV